MYPRSICNHSTSLELDHSLTTSNMTEPTKIEPKWDVSPTVASSDRGDAEFYIDPVAEKKLLRKLDLYLAPLMTIIFLCAYLDRGNIGNAASAGMTKDLKMTSGQLGSKLIHDQRTHKRSVLMRTIRCRYLVLRLIREWRSSSILGIEEVPS